jgi:hypothetical protein
MVVARRPFRRRQIYHHRPRPSNSQSAGQAGRNKARAAQRGNFDRRLAAGTSRLEGIAPKRPAIPTRQGSGQTPGNAAIARYFVFIRIDPAVKDVDDLRDSAIRANPIWTSRSSAIPINTARPRRGGRRDYWRDLSLTQIKPLLINCIVSVSGRSANPIRSQTF